ncbi:MAG: phytanoyl-CoA dioxygenase family protein [Alphaproteobacteria bacterium]|nr:phytanoyl-CoA dioxygenase family protein [Alphaproteobacteria bacterium]
MSALTADEVEAYRTEGYVVPRLRLPAALVDQLRSTMERLIAENPGIRPERLVSAHIDGQGSGGKNAEGVRGSAAFLDLARDRTIVDAVAQLIGEDVILWGCQIFCKPGGDGMEVPWHQDGHYWPIRPLATCTAWVALDPSTRANGCLRVIPGSHRPSRLYDHMKEDRTDLVLNQRLLDGQFDPAMAVDLELEPGQMSLHDVYMIHGSAPNRSPQRRAGVAIRYMPGTSVFERGLMKPGAQSGYTVDFSTRPLWLLKGRDRTGRNDFSVGHARAAAE